MPGCGGDIRLIAFITDLDSLRNILTLLGEPLEPPLISPARGSPTDCGELVQVHDDRALFSSCATSTSTASDGIQCHRADDPREERFQCRSVPTRKLGP